MDECGKGHDRHRRRVPRSLTCFWLQGWICSRPRATAWGGMGWQGFCRRMCRNSESARRRTRFRNVLGLFPAIQTAQIGLHSTISFPMDILRGNHWQQEGLEIVSPPWMRIWTYYHDSYRKSHRTYAEGFCYPTNIMSESASILETWSYTAKRCKLFVGRCKQCKQPWTSDNAFGHNIKWLILIWASKQ